MKITYSLAEQKHIHYLASMWQKLSYGQMLKDDLYKGSLEFNSGYDQMKESLSNSNCGIFIVFFDGQPQGFVEVWLEAEKFMLPNNCGYILHYYINEEARTNSEVNSFGIALNLYLQAEKWVRKNGKSFLVADVFEHNQQIISLLKYPKMKIYKKRLVREI